MIQLACCCPQEWNFHPWHHQTGTGQQHSKQVHQGLLRHFAFIAVSEQCLSTILSTQMIPEPRLLKDGLHTFSLSTKFIVPMVGWWILWETMSWGWPCNSGFGLLSRMKVMCMWHWLPGLMFISFALSMSLAKALCADDWSKKFSVTVFGWILLNNGITLITYCILAYNQWINCQMLPVQSTYCSSTTHPHFSQGRWSLENCASQVFFFWARCSHKQSIGSIG